MKVYVNDQAMTLMPATTVAQLLDQLALTEVRVAVECNAELVPRSQHASTVLHDGDRVEIVKAVGGG